MFTAIPDRSEFKKRKHEHEEQVNERLRSGLPEDDDDSIDSVASLFNDLKDITVSVDELKKQVKKARTWLDCLSDDSASISSLTSNDK